MKLIYFPVRGRMEPARLMLELVGARYELETIPFELWSGPEGKARMLEQTPFEDRDAIAVTKEFAQDHGGLSAMGDLKRVPRVTLGAPPEFRTRFAGLKGLEEEYGLTNMKFKPLAIGANYDALDTGSVEAADVFTTDGQLASGKYVVLDDPKAIFGFQNVAPVVSEEVLQQQGPKFKDNGAVSRAQAPQRHSREGGNPCPRDPRECGASLPDNEN